MLEPPLHFRNFETKQKWRPPIPPLQRLSDSLSQFPKLLHLLSFSLFPFPRLLSLYLHSLCAMANQESSVRLTRAAKRRAEEAMTETPQQSMPPTKKRVVLGEISSNILGNANLKPCSEAQKPSRSRPRKASKPVSSWPSEKTPAEDVMGSGKAVAEDVIDAVLDDPQMCGPYVASIYEYLRNMEVSLCTSSHLKWFYLW